MSYRFQALLFDLDDTLIDGSGNEDSVLLTCHDIATTRPSLDPMRLLEANRNVWPEHWLAVEEAWTLGRMDGKTVSIETWRRTLHVCGCADEALAMWAQERHWAHMARTIRLFDDVRAMLETLAGRVPLGLVTNGASDTQRHALHNLGIERLFTAVFISGEHGFAKPAPEVFAATLKELGVAPDHACHVGDSLRTDVAGAKAAGLTAIWLNRLELPAETSGPSPDHEILSLADLPRLLSR
jgi:putative hydrolase of the HAD superfamily